jgi:hypothetical protein
MVVWESSILGPESCVSMVVFAREESSAEDDSLIPSSVAHESQPLKPHSA